MRQSDGRRQSLLVNNETPSRLFTATVFRTFQAPAVGQLWLIYELRTTKRGYIGTRTRSDNTLLLWRIDQHNPLYYTRDLGWGWISPQADIRTANHTIFSASTLKPRDSQFRCGNRHLDKILIFEREHVLYTAGGHIAQARN